MTTEYEREAVAAMVAKAAAHGQTGKGEWIVEHGIRVIQLRRSCDGLVFGANIGRLVDKGEPAKYVGEFAAGVIVGNARAQVRAAPAPGWNNKQAQHDELHLIRGGDRMLHILPFDYWRHKSKFANEADATAWARAQAEAGSDYYAEMIRRLEAQ